MSLIGAVLVIPFAGVICLAWMLGKLPVDRAPPEYSVTLPRPVFINHAVSTAQDAPAYFMIIHPRQNAPTTATLQ